MRSNSETRLAASIAAVAAVSALWCALTALFVEGFPFSAASIISLFGLAGFIAASGVLIQNLAYKPFRRARALIEALSGGGLRDRFYIEDVDSEPGRIQFELNALMDRLEENMARQRQFVGAISHDIRTPLTIMKGDIEVALLKERNHSEYEEVLQSNLEEVERIHHMVEDLVTLARADYGEMGLNLKTVSLGSLMAEVREGFTEAARRKELILDAYIEGDVLMEGDTARLRQLIHNLIDNAIHYTPSGGGVEITMVQDRERDEVQFRVKDTGVGIAPKDLPHIFEPFYRGTPSLRTRHDGYGLGLAICDHIVRAHGGKISVESRQGRDSGATFTVNMPRKSKPGLIGPGAA